jgi:RNA polymerase subunit RPABC4/transcription elongation factor Spt4
VRVWYNTRARGGVIMSIQLVCPNGHRLTAKESSAGQTGKCPVCQAPVTIPIPNRSVTADSAIVVAVLGELNAQSAAQRVGRTVLAPKRKPAVATKESSAFARTRVCPNCERDIDLGYHICPYCHAYLTGLNEF